MAKAIEIAVTICVVFLLVGVACLLVIAAWMMLIDWRYGDDEEDRWDFWNSLTEEEKDRFR